MKQLRNSENMQYSFCNNLYRHLEKSIVTIRQLENKKKKGKEFVRQVFDNHADVCLRIQKEYGATMVKDLINYFKIKYDNKEKHK